MNIISLDAIPRQAGKSVARALRRAGSVPCVLYGRKVDTVTFSTEERNLDPLIHTSEAHKVQITLGDNSWECILKDVAFHPVTDRPMHADFQVLQPSEAVSLSIPIRYAGTPIGQSRGGRVRYTVTELVVSCLPRHIPAQIEVDVQEVDIGGAIHVRDLMTENLKFQAPDDQILMSIARPRAEVVIEEDEGEIVAPE